MGVDVTHRDESLSLYGWHTKSWPWNGSLKVVAELVSIGYWIFQQQWAHQSWHSWWIQMRVGWTGECRSDPPTPLGWCQSALELVHVMHVYVFESTAFSVCHEDAGQSQHYRSQVRRLARRIFRYNGAKISVKRELHFFDPHAGCWIFAPSKYLKFIGNCKLRPDISAERFHEWEWLKLYGSGPRLNWFQLLGAQPRRGRAYTITQEIWRFYVSPDNTWHSSIQCDLLPLGELARSTRHSARRKRAMAGKNSDSRRTQLQSNAHIPNQYSKIVRRIPRI